MRWRAGSRAAFQRQTVEAVLKDVEAVPESGFAGGYVD